MPTLFLVTVLVAICLAQNQPNCAEFIDRPPSFDDAQLVRL